VWLGISVDGLLTAEKHGDNLLVSNKFYLWTNIEKISFNKQRFSVRPKLSVSNGTTDKYNFFTETCRKLVEQTNFFVVQVISLNPIKFRWMTEFFLIVGCGLHSLSAFWFITRVPNKSWLLIFNCTITFPLIVVHLFTVGYTWYSKALTENAGQEMRDQKRSIDGRKCRTGKYRTKMPGWKT